MSFSIYRIIPLPKEAFCVGCGCSDSKACLKNGEPCSWIAIDRDKQQGVCSNCLDFVSPFVMGDYA